MTSVLNVDTIANKAGTGPVALTKQSAPKAWANLNGTGTIALRDSFNTSGVTDNGTGHYTFSLSNSMDDANYAIMFGDSAADSNHDGGWLGIRNGTTNTASSFVVTTDGRITGEFDPLYTMMSVLGDLA